VRPGLLNYSFYASDRHPVGRATEPKAKAKPVGYYLRNALRLAAILVLVGGIVITFRSLSSHQAASSGGSSSNVVPSQAAATAEGPKECNANDDAKHVFVSISERHLWACEYHKVAYNTPVITGMEFLPADLTPTGTYKVYDKQTNVTLTGSDTTGNWSDPVDYWMPFLQNQYGTYGFHDATWRPNNAFGKVDPNSKDASHGCVELPLSASKWLYGWTPVGTQVTIRS
jgi:hypothetical protein